MIHISTWKLGVRILMLGFIWLSYLKYELTGGYLKINDIVCMIFLYVEVREMIFNHLVIGTMRLPWPP